MRYLGKGIVTVILLWIVFRNVDVASVFVLLARMQPLWALGALMLTFLLIASDAVLFSRVMRIFTIQFSFGVALLYSFVSWFFSNLALSTVGGDIFRSAQLSRVGTPVGVALWSVVLIRTISLATLFIVMLAGFPIALGLVKTSRDAALLAFVVAAAGGALGVFFGLCLLPARLVRQWPVLNKVSTIANDVRAILVPSANAIVAWAAALTQHLLRVGVLAALAVGLGLNIPLAVLFAFTPAALLAAMLPISFGGWGIREAAFIYFLGTAAVSGEAALTLSISFGILRLLVGALGGLAWVMAKKDHFRVDGAPV